MTSGFVVCTCVSLNLYVLMFFFVSFQFVLSYSVLFCFALFYLILFYCHSFHACFLLEKDRAWILQGGKIARVPE